MKCLCSHQCYCRCRKEVVSQSHGLFLSKTEVLYHWLQANNSVCSQLGKSALDRIQNEQQQQHHTDKATREMTWFCKFMGIGSFETQSFLAASDCLIIRELATFPTRAWLPVSRAKKP